MRGFIRKYYLVLIILLSLSSFVAYQSISTIIIWYQDTYDPYYNPLAGGSEYVNVFMGNKGDKGKCDTLIQVKRGVQKGDLIDHAIKKLFEGPVFSEELVLDSAFMGYDKIYNGVTVRDNIAFIDFKSEILDPNSTFYKDFTKTCAVGQLNQLFFTVRQFKEIQNVVIAIDGSPKKFMQARQVNCDLKENQTRFEKECLTNIP